MKERKEMAMNQRGEERGDARVKLEEKRRNGGRKVMNNNEEGQGWRLRE